MAPLASATVVDAVRGRAPGTSAIRALRQVAGELGTDAGPLPVLGEPVVPCLRTAAAAESVLARVVHYLAVLEGELTRALAETSDEPDPALHCSYVARNDERLLKVVASNSFGFGGSNACLVFGASA